MTRYESGVEEAAQRTGRSLVAAYKALARLRKLLHDCVTQRFIFGGNRMNDNERVELNELISALIDGRATTAEHRRLEEMLAVVRRSAPLLRPLDGDVREPL